MFTAERRPRLPRRWRIGPMERHDGDGVGERLVYYGRYLRAIFSADGLQSADIDDLLQDTYLRIAKRLNKDAVLPDSDDALKHWLAFHARRQRDEYWRKKFGRGRKRHPAEVELSSIEASVKDSRGRVRANWFAHSDDAEIKWDEFLDVIRLEVCERAAHVVKLRRWRFTQKEIAELLNVDVKTVGRYLAKAKKVAAGGL